jgi:hypothetical protein
MSVILENIETGEIQEVGSAGLIPKGWRVKGIGKPKGGLVLAKPEDPQIDVKLAVWAQKIGLPVAQFFDAARWLLDKHCPYCQLGTQILKRVEELGEDRTRELVAQILEAKKRQDLEALERIRKSLAG